MYTHMKSPKKAETTSTIVTSGKQNTMKVINAYAHLNYYPFSEMIAVIFPSDLVRNATKHSYFTDPCTFIH